MNPRKQALSALGTLCLTLTGCGDDENDLIPGQDEIVIDDDLAIDAADAAMVAEDTIALSYAMTDASFDVFSDGPTNLAHPAHLALASVTPVSPDMLAAQVAANASSFFSPEPCVTATSHGATATVMLDGCETAFGATGITGAIVVTFGQAEGGFSARLATVGLAIDGGQLGVEADMTGSERGDERILSATSTTIWHRRNVTINTDLIATIRWTRGSTCVTCTGDGPTEIDGRAFQAELSEVRLCSDECPSGGTLTWRTRDSELTLSFDGTSSPALVSSDGTDEEIALTCEGSS